MLRFSIWFHACTSHSLKKHPLHQLFFFSEGKESVEESKDVTHLGLFLDRRAVYRLLEVEGRLLLLWMGTSMFVWELKVTSLESRYGLKLLHMNHYGVQKDP